MKSPRAGPQWRYEKLITPQQVIHEGEKATLIMMPPDGPFAGWKLWYPSKLVKYGYPYLSLIFKKGMEFRLHNGSKEKVLTDDQFLRLQTCSSLSTSGK